jgi:sugar lactone lactonase YvrE
MPTFEVFGPDGSLYVSDASAPVIWRVPPGGGQAEIWFADPRLSGYTTTTVDGIAIDPSGRELYLATGPPEDIRIYHLPLAHPDAAHLQLFHTYQPLSPMTCTDQAANVTGPNGPPALVGCLGLNIAGAGGIVFGKSGRLYVSLISVGQLSILSPDGYELLRFPDSEENMQLDNPVNGPFNLSLDDSGRLLIANNGDPSNDPPGGPHYDSKSWAILSVQVHDTPGRLFRPKLP